MRPAARLTDLVVCTCGCRPGMIISVMGVKTFIGNLPAATLGSICSNCCGGPCPCPNPIITASTKTFINGLPAARLGDLAVCGIIAKGSPRSFIG